MMSTNCSMKSTAVEWKQFFSLTNLLLLSVPWGREAYWKLRGDAPWLYMEKWIQMAPKEDSDRHRDVLPMSPFKVGLAVGLTRRQPPGVCSFQGLPQHLAPGLLTARSFWMGITIGFLPARSWFFSLPFTGVDSSWTFCTQTLLSICF